MGTPITMTMAKIEVVVVRVTGLMGGLYGLLMAVLCTAV